MFFCEALSQCQQLRSASPLMRFVKCDESNIQSQAIMDVEDETLTMAILDRMKSVPQNVFRQVKCIRRPVSKAKINSFHGN